ncbi:MAG: class I SAM-dependent methyltransferase, partial [Usitatibacter sp.]
MATIAAPKLVFDAPLSAQLVDGRSVLHGRLRVAAPVVFFPYFRIRIESAAGAVAEGNSRDGYLIGWLPRGNYRLDILLPGPAPAGPARYRIEAGHREAMADVAASGIEGWFEAPVQGGGAPARMAWSVESIAPNVPLAELSWRKGHADWFYRHFDHAGPTIISYMLGDSPLLRGRILDVGCGDGITDLSIALRTGCEELVGIDPFRGYERLPQIIADNHLPPDAVPGNLRFMPESGNSIPFPDDRFDVVVSWGSLEHIAGGYAKTLSEIRR